MAEQFRVPSPLVTRDFARVCRKILFIQAAEREGKRGREKPAGNSNWLIPRGYTVQEHAKNIFLREVKALAIAVPLPFAVSYHGLSLVGSLFRRVCTVPQNTSSKKRHKGGGEGLFATVLSTRNQDCFLSSFSFFADSCVPKGARNLKLSLPHSRLLFNVPCLFPTGLPASTLR